MPFAQDERKTVDFVVAQVAKGGKFDTYLPLGGYKVDGKSAFTVVENKGNQVILK